MRMRIILGILMALCIVAVSYVSAIAHYLPTHNPDPTTYPTRQRIIYTSPLVPVITPTPAVGRATVRLSANIREEGAACVNAEIESVTDLGAFSFTVRYPTSYLSNPTGRLEEFLGSTGRIVSPISSATSAGRYFFGGYSRGRQSGATGDGVLATICFEPHATDPEQIDLDFNYVQLGNIEGNSIPVHFEGTSFIIINCIRADVDCDGDVDILDIQQVASKWNTQRGSDGYEERLDLDEDGDIDVIDIQAVAAQYEVAGQSAGVVSQAGPVTLRLSPELLALGLGERGTVILTADNAQDLAAFETNLSYDPTLLRVESIRLTDWLGNTGRTVKLLDPVIDNVQGTAGIGAFSTGTQDGVSGTGSLAVLEVTTLGVGDGSLNLHDSQATTRNADFISVTEIDRMVQVNVAMPAEMLYLPLVRW